MDTETYFRFKKNVTNNCKDGGCWEQYSSDCPLHIMNNRMHVSCDVLEQTYPKVAEEILYETIREKFPNGYVVCIKDKKFEDIDRCNKYETCGECK